jgi:carboxypeptidase Taq
MYHEYLGLEVPDAQSGILQDMHWPYAYFGYFPTYALGSAFAAQFNAAMRKDIPVDDLLREGRTEEIFAWLKEHVQHWGAFLSTDEIIRRACGEDFSPRFWTEYITKKYTELYRL